jgi:hypothetical protein
MRQGRSTVKQPWDAGWVYRNGSSEQQLRPYPLRRQSGSKLGALAAAQHSGMAFR